jgi:hypothetical protein
VVDGKVTGFEGDGRAKARRGWIKTDAEIGPGNSGGLAADKEGRIIGVPTEVRSDPLVVGVTRGRLRPINAAKRIIGAARKGNRYRSPLFVRGTGRERWNLRSWSNAAPRDDGCAFNPVTSYAGSQVGLTAIWDVTGMRPGEDVRYRWLYLDSERDAEPDFLGDVSDIWKRAWPESLRCVYFSYSSAGTSIKDGVYVVAILAGPNLRLAGSARVKVGAGVAPATVAAPAPIIARSGRRALNVSGDRDCQGWRPDQILGTGVDLHGVALPNGEPIAEGGRVGLSEPLGDPSGYSTLDQANEEAARAVDDVFNTKTYRWLVLRRADRFYAFVGRLYGAEESALGRPPCRITSQDGEVVAWHALRFVGFPEPQWIRYDWRIGTEGSFTPVEL